MDEKTFEQFGKFISDSFNFFVTQMWEKPI